jgi:plasmid stability protein
MSAMTVRKIPPEVQQRLRQMAVEQNTSVEALARRALADFTAQSAAATSVNLAALKARSQALGLPELESGWIEGFDDPSWTRRLFGDLEDDLH